MFDGRASQRIVELRTMVAAHPIGAAVDREHTAQGAVVTTNEEINRGWQSFQTPFFSQGPWLHSHNLHFPNQEPHIPPLARTH